MCTSCIAVPNGSLGKGPKKGKCKSVVFDHTLLNPPEPHLRSPCCEC